MEGKEDSPAFVPASETEEAPASLPPVLRPRAPERFLRAIEAFFKRHTSAFARYFSNEPTFLVVLGPFLLVTTLLYCRFPWTNYIFDEQEALLASPYINRVNNAQGLVGEKYTDAIYVDFWGLPPNASIGSYRPIPNLLWRSLVEIGAFLQSPFDWVQAHFTLWQLVLIAAAVIISLLATLFGRAFVRGRSLLYVALGVIAVTGLTVGVSWRLPPWIHGLPQLSEAPLLSDLARRSWFQHIWNLIFHAVNGALFTAMAWRYSRKRFFAWMIGGTFITSAILTEAVCGCVGVADVLGGMGALLALAALSMRAYAMPFAVFLAVLLGLFSKESAVVCVPLVPFAALLAAPVLHPEKPARVIRAVLALAGTVAAFVLYVEMRKLWFPSPLPGELTTELPPFASKSQVLIRDFMVWFHQPPLPHDPLNNPFADPAVGPDYRLAGALRVYERGVGQVIFPKTLSGDYSSPQEPVPAKLVYSGSILGTILTLVPLGAALALVIVGIRREIKGPRVPVEKRIESLEASPPAWRAAVRLLGVGVILAALKGWLYFAPGSTARPLVLIVAAAVAAALIIDKVRTRDEHMFLPRGVARYVVEVLVILGSYFLVQKMLSIPPAQLPDSADPMEITIPTAKLARFGLYLGGGALVLGALVEIFWRAKKQSKDLWAISAVSVGLIWLVVSYFPHSNIPALLPTVRAERLWYFPVLGTTMVVATALYFATKKLREHHLRTLAVLVPLLFLGFQAVRARTHALDYWDDLAFWNATKDAVPNSSKAHLNYSVMVGARGDYQTRLIHSKRAMELAPDWAMAHVYTGDTLCRMHRAEEAWPYYKSGFDKGPNDKGLISLALQCMWDEKVLKNHDAELREIAADHTGSWIAYLATDTLDNGDKNGGVDPQYRPRNYNEGPKKKAASATDTGTGTETATEWIDDSDIAMTAAEPSGSEGGSRAGKVEAKGPMRSAQATVSSQP